MSFTAFGHFLLAAVRLSAFFLTVPIFSNTLVPGRVKTGLAFILAFLLVPLTSGPELMGISIIHYLLYIFRECLLGLAMGFLLSLLFSVVRMGGELIGTMVGFSFLNVLDPTSNQEVSILGEIYYQIMILYFFALQGQDILFHAVVDGFRLIPLGLGHPGQPFFDVLSHLFLVFFYLGIQFSMPLLGLVLLTEVSMGLIARAVPQLNVFQVGFSLKILVGFVGMLFGSVFFGEISGSLFSRYYQDCQALFKSMGVIP